MDVGEILWTPAPERAASTTIARFGAHVGHADYESLWQWSVTDQAAFYDALWRDAGIVASEPYERVHGELRMPGTEWFTGARLSFSENLLARGLSQAGGKGVALVGAGEGREPVRRTWNELNQRVGALQRGLDDLGVAPLDRVAALVPNCIEAVELMLASTALGATWTSCSPDFGAQGVVDRFAQVEPRVLVVANGYRYNGRTFDLSEKVQAVLAALPTVTAVVVVDFADVDLDIGLGALSDAVRIGVEELVARGGDGGPDHLQVPPDHPLYVMYSSGTTGRPKSIVHSVAGTLVTHVKEHRYHTDLIGGRDTIMWFTTCGWMMWNWLVSALAQGVTVVCYDGSPVHPDPGVLWRLAESEGITHFGTSPRYLAGLAQAGVEPRAEADLSSLAAVLSTGSPLNPEQFDWVYANVADDVHLASVSGGTDLIGCFAGGVPSLPVRRGELQARTLGMAMEAWDEHGRPVVGQKGELVCVRPFPSMPLRFWGDPDGSRYHEAYFAEHPGVWTHGDYVEVRPTGGVVIYGRSDTTLNPGGVRIGTAEIYRAVEGVEEVTDSIVVGLPSDGDVEVVLFVVLAEGATLDEGLAADLRRAIRTTASPRHVPAKILAVPAVPYTISNKKVEKAVRTVLTGGTVDNLDALADPTALDAYADVDLDSAL